MWKSVSYEKQGDEITDDVIYCDVNTIQWNWMRCNYHAMKLLQRNYYDEIIAMKLPDTSVAIGTEKFGLRY